MKHLFAVFTVAALLAVGVHVFPSPTQVDESSFVDEGLCACSEQAEPSFGDLMLNEFSPISRAHAADVWVAALTSSDAGATNVVTMNGKSTYKLKCKAAACHSFGTAASPPAPDCTKDSMLVQYTTGLTGGTPPLINYISEFENGGLTRVAARAPDGGNPDCNLHIVYKNP